jgi:SpoVK/Ycf46/Vps4 family AAA+-type ATPase
MVATNHVERFDPAIRRRGRFDMIVPVMPPNYREKSRKWPVIRTELAKHGLAGRNHEASWARGVISDLTFDECDDLRKMLPTTSSRDEIVSHLREVAAACTLRQEISLDGVYGEKADPSGVANSATTWKTQLEGQQKYLRIPPKPGIL